ncbi:MAG: HDIG domain-containing protein [Candidatus Krumholzibacteriota bacterium]|nr:HDIG domain-containing protein [Candidatus Krumholzibacteriota bacterium]
MSREDGMALVRRHVTKKNLVKHALAVEAVLRSLARLFGEDEEVWGIAGLLHDLDYETTVDDPPRHGYVTREMLEGDDLPDEILQAIVAHVGHEGVERKTLLDKAIYCTDPVTGLIVASALMHPSKSLAGMDAEFVGKRFREKRFAAGADRDAIAECRELGLELHVFLGIALEAMQGIAGDLGLQGTAHRSSGGAAT